MENLIQFIVFMEVFRGWSPRSLVEKRERKNRPCVWKTVRVIKPRPELIYMSGLDIGFLDPVNKKTKLRYLPSCYSAELTLWGILSQSN